MMDWQPNNEDGGWDFDVGVVSLAVRPLMDSGPSASVSWHASWGDESRFDSYADTFENAKRQSIEFALRLLKADRKKLLNARFP